MNDAYLEECPVCNPQPIQPRVERLSVSLSPTLTKYVRETAARRGITVSRVITEALTHKRHTDKAGAA